jgi:ribonuclease R
MYELFEILRTRREARGSIDFDLPEAEVMLDASGDIEAIRPSERNVAHRLIEEFMLAANEVVAQELVFATQPGIYRVHQQPDPQKLEDLREILKEFKLTLRGDLEEVRPGELQRVLKAVAGTPEERFLTELVLRSMKRASYQEESIGHFALALQHYCHFTSPIRRYPDLMVHRAIRHTLNGGTAENFAYTHPDMVLLGAHCSSTERRADDATRDAVSWLKCEYMMDKVGEVYPGTISSVTSFGLFVELDEIFVEGLVHVTALDNDYYHFDPAGHRLRGERTGKLYRLADRITVKVVRVNLDDRKVDFELAQNAEELHARPREPGEAHGARTPRKSSKKKRSRRR